MDSLQYSSYTELFTDKLKNCKKKKDYKRLCKEMIVQFDAIDKIDYNQFKIFSSIIGSDNYSKVITMAVKLYLLQEHGYDIDGMTAEEIDDY